MVNRKPPRKKFNNHGVMNFTEWKQRAMELMCKDEDLCKLLKYDTPDALSKPKLSEDESYELVDTHIFGYRYNPVPVAKTGSFIGMGLSNFVPQEGFRQFSDDYLMGYLYFYILVDTEIMKTDTGYRQDLILSRIYEIFHESREFGVGETRVETIVELWQHNNKFGGYSAGYKIIEMK
ncbi:hypothetical protein [Vagococcus fluvialis]|uniref:hypothetical protein n=1 Tax=Vagococcus fluvialis TaxID=2738 RepID=UPI001D0A4C69|nr:hypothetical protein [Vagococcus fluvialis]UDM72741.1 hypothetical protein K5L00_14380 [Vagococcus fluvialis]UDM78463.1 hypothetical protein K5K98_14585 [Vagococcus fluvialis]UDM84016.1 hypothetical protein K5K96_14405 [Vagococcus fluvialis]